MRDLALVLPPLDPFLLLTAIHLIAASLGAVESTPQTTGVGPTFYVASALRQAHNKSFLVLEQAGSRHNQRWIIKPDYGDHEAVREVVACATTKLLGFDLCYTSAHGIAIPMADGPEYHWNPAVRDEIMRECTQKSSVHCHKGGAYMGAALKFLPAVKPADSDIGIRLVSNSTAYMRFVLNAAQLLTMDTIFQIDTRFRNCFFLTDNLQLTSMDSGDWHYMSFRLGSTIFR